MRLAEEIAFELYGGYHSIDLQLRRQIDDLAERLWQQLYSDEEFMQGVHLDESCRTDEQEALEFGHEHACDAVLARIEATGKAQTDELIKKALSALYEDVQKIRDGGPQTAPAPAAEKQPADPEPGFSWG